MISFKSFMKDICGTKLDYTIEDIRGMLYFLTGNCHIEWV